MSSFKDALANKDMVVTVELEPPKGVDLGPLAELAQGLAGRVDAVVLADNPRAEARQGPVLAAHKLVKHAGVAVVVTVACRDRNRLALTSLMLEAAAAGAESLLVVGGDFVSLGDHPQAKPVYDLDSVQALQLAAGLAQGRDLAGGALEGQPPGWLLGATAAPEAEPQGPQLMKLRKKLAAGAEYIITRPLIDAEAYGRLRGELNGARVIAGVESAGPDDDGRAAELAAALKAMRPGGLHLAVAGDQARLPALLDACGL